MKISERMRLIIERGINYRSLESSPYERFLEWGINSSLINTIKTSAEAKQDFQIEVADLEHVIGIMKEQVEQLLKHPDFDPTKEELREKYKIQFESYPLEWNGNLYYLYPKGGRFPIDEKISSLVGFMNTMKAHIQENSPLKYNYRDNRPS